MAYDFTIKITKILAKCDKTIGTKSTDYTHN